VGRRSAERPNVEHEHADDRPRQWMGVPRSGPLPANEVGDACAEAVARAGQAQLFDQAQVDPAGRLRVDASRGDEGRRPEGRFERNAPNPPNDGGRGLLNY
jgi:hypothetical protein